VCKWHSELLAVGNRTDSLNLLSSRHFYCNRINGIDGEVFKCDFISAVCVILYYNNIIVFIDVELCSWSPCAPV